MIDLTTPCIIPEPGKYYVGWDGYPRDYSPKLRNYTSAIRVLCEKEFGIKDGYEPDHLCKNKMCLNLQHIEIVTSAENNSRAHRKLTPDQVKDIRRQHKSGMSYTTIAAQYNICFQNVGMIVQRKTWKDLED